jgi:peroxiredoxin
MRTLFCSLCALSLLASPGAAEEKKLPQQAVSFALPDTQGKTVAFKDFAGKKAVVVVFLGTECPLVQAYVPKLIELQKQFGPQGVQVVAINSNSHDSAADVARHAKEMKITFPVLKDADQKVANLFDAKRTPEAFLIAPQGKIVYRGRIDDQYGIGFQRPYAVREDLVEALKELLAGRAITHPVTTAPGCIISREKPLTKEGTITYASHVSKIIQKHCMECHRPENIGPFSLLTYEKAKAWSETIKEVVAEKRMPPWHADPKHGVFANDRSMPEQERQTLLAWIEQGCPKGEEKEMPPVPTFAEQGGWRIGKPDHIITMQRAFKVPAKAPRGGVPYQHWMVPTNFKEDVWVKAVEARPGNKAVVHHILAFVIEREQVNAEPGSNRGARNADAIGNNLLVGFAPGDLPVVFEPGQGRKIPKGSFLLLQLHYTPNGTEQEDLSSIGIIVSKEPPQHVVRTRAIMKRRFAIPPFATNHEVVAQSVFHRDTAVISLMPHLHVRGKDFLYKVVYPDGREEVILWIPKYDFSWQIWYRFKEPLKLPAGSKIVCTAHYDNSENNPNNPDPTKTVFWGDQTWEEMMIGWLDYYYLDEAPKTVTRKGE